MELYKNPTKYVSCWLYFYFTLYYFFIPSVWPINNFSKKKNFFLFLICFLTLFSNKDEHSNVFSNDGSFLENFKKITEQAKKQVCVTASGCSSAFENQSQTQIQNQARWVFNSLKFFFFMVFFILLSWSFSSLVFPSTHFITVSMFRKRKILVCKF